MFSMNEWVHMYTGDTTRNATRTGVPNTLFGIKIFIHCTWWPKETILSNKPKVSEWILVCSMFVCLMLHNLLSFRNILHHLYRFETMLCYTQFILRIYCTYLFCVFFSWLYYLLMWTSYHARKYVWTIYHCFNALWCMLASHVSFKMWGGQRHFLKNYMYNVMGALHGTVKFVVISIHTVDILW